MQHNNKDNATNEDKKYKMKKIKPINLLTSMDFKNQDTALKQMKTIYDEIKENKQENIFYLCGLPNSGRKTLFQSLSKSLDLPFLLIEQEMNIKDFYDLIMQSIIIEIYDTTQRMTGEVVRFTDEILIVKNREMVSEFEICEIIYKNLISRNVKTSDYISIDPITKSIDILGCRNLKSKFVGKQFIDEKVGEIFPHKSDDTFMQHKSTILKINLEEYNRLYYREYIEYPLYNNKLEEMIKKGEAEIKRPLILVEENLSIEFYRIIETTSRWIFSPIFFLKTNKEEEEYQNVVFQ